MSSETPKVQLLVYDSELDRDGEYAYINNAFFTDMNDSLLKFDRPTTVPEDTGVAEEIDGGYIVRNVRDSTDFKVKAPNYEDQIVNSGTASTNFPVEVLEVALIREEPTDGGGGGGGGARLGECFIATAATGGTQTAEVQFLRSIRDNMLLKTRAGRRLFEEFYRHYYQFSPAIVDVMNENANFRNSMEWAFVSPLINYYKLVVNRPDFKTNDMDNAPEHIRNYVKILYDDMDRWLSKLPLPQDFHSLPLEDAAMELSIVLRFVLRSPDTRRSYLERLKSLGVLPLYGNKEDLVKADQVLAENNVNLEDRKMILGSKILDK